MAEETLNSLADLKQVMEGTAEAPVTDSVEEIEAIVYEQKIDEQGRSYATGKRKDAVARVWIKPGPGTVTVNGRELKTYFARPVLQMLIAQPFQVTDREGQFDVIATVKGGGLSGQAGAVKLGIARALVKADVSLEQLLRALKP